MYKILNEKVDGFHVIELTERFQGCQFVYGEMKFADEENEDGSIQMDFDYEITNGYTVPKDQMEDFQKYLGDTLLILIENAIADKSMVFAGGTDDGALEVPLEDNNDS